MAKLKKLRKKAKQDTTTFDFQRCLVALTATELKNLHATNGKNKHSIGSIEFAHPKYQVPFPSPASSEAGDDVGDLATLVNDGEAETAEQESDGASTNASNRSLYELTKLTLYDSNDSEACNAHTEYAKICGQVDDTAHTLPYNCDMHAYSHLPATHLDLGKILMPFYGYYIVRNAFGTSSFDIGENLSDYYSLPLIEHKPQEHGSNIVPPGPPTLGPEKPIVMPAAVDEIDDSEDELEDEDKNPTFPFLHPPREVPPGQAIMIHLLYHGTPISQIITQLATLHKDFVITEGQRWMVPTEELGVRRRVPQHSQLNQRILDEVMVAAYDKHWEKWMERLEILEALVKNGKGEKYVYEVAKLKVWKRMRLYNVEHMVQSAAENYVFQRFLGTQPNMDIASGPLLRPGDW